MGIFVGVNYGGGKGWKYCWSQRIGRGWGRRVMHADFFHTGWSGGTAEGRRVWQAYCFHTWKGKYWETNGLPAGMGNGA